VLVLSCNVDFGSSGAPIFSIRDGVARVVSVVSAKAEVDGKPVALGTLLDEPLRVLRDELGSDGSLALRSVPGVRMLSGGLAGNSTGGAKFVKPGQAEAP
jgi:hypothetical protein